MKVFHWKLLKMIIFKQEKIYFLVDFVLSYSYFYRKFLKNLQSKANKKSFVTNLIFLNSKRFLIFEKKEFKDLIRC